MTTLRFKFARLRTSFGPYKFSAMARSARTFGKRVPTLGAATSPLQAVPGRKPTVFTRALSSHQPPIPLRVLRAMLSLFRQFPDGSQPCSPEFFRPPTPNPPPRPPCPPCDVFSLVSTLVRCRAKDLALPVAVPPEPEQIKAICHFMLARLEMMAANSRFFDSGDSAIAPNASTAAFASALEGTDRTRL
jgi:hypothetical protein